eukprot:9337146-Karenia_brevis.AAC.1
MVHGDCCTSYGSERDFEWIKDMMETWFEVKLRGIMGLYVGDMKEVSILNRRLRYGVGGIEYEAGPKHRGLVVEYFVFDASTTNLVENGDREDNEEE